ncbi:hypothetical protein ACFSTJ_20780 [Ottowia pentelensis]
MFKPVQPDALLQLLRQLADPAAPASVTAEEQGQIDLQPLLIKRGKLSLQ